jgi:hypothetical protein
MLKNVYIFTNSLHKKYYTKFIYLFQCGKISSTENVYLLTQLELLNKIKNVLCRCSKNIQLEIYITKIYRYQCYFVTFLHSYIS